MLAAAEAGYRLGVGIRAWTFSVGLRRVRRLPCPVISVGNLTVGGTGKTPCTVALAQRLRTWGQAPGILLRGYGRRGSGVRVAADTPTGLPRWEAVGDEAVLLARRLPGVPVVVGADRFQSGQEALRRSRLDVLLLDDGFQHRQLHRDLDVVLVDATDPFGGGRLLPRGRLREPVAALRRAGAVILSRSDQASDLRGLRRRLEQLAPEAVQILARHRPSGLMDPAGGGERPPGWLSGRRLLAVSGIANPEGFHRSLTDLGGVLAGTLAFPDHHPYGPADIARTRQVAEEARAELIITTEKDAVRLAAREGSEFARPALLVLRVELELFEGAEALDALLRRAVQGARA
jgi:tetraacyldisaccharide 4'-kinase